MFQPFGWSIMLRRTALVASFLSALSLPALAGDMPDLLAKKYATDPAACNGQKGLEEVDGLVIDKTGVTGVEFSCSFLDFWSDKTGTTALVSCSDDSGITRPDFLSIVDVGNGEIRVQSQNEFIMGTVALNLAPPPAEDGKEESEDSGALNFDYVSGIYALCGAAATGQ